MGDALVEEGTRHRKTDDEAVAVPGWDEEELERLELTADPATMEVVASEEVRGWIAEHGGELFVWVSIHGWGYFRMALLEASTRRPLQSGLFFRRSRVLGFDLLLQADRGLWPKKLELDLRGRRKRVRAYWNGLAWVA